jgi:hypothetical protein
MGWGLFTGTRRHMPISGYKLAAADVPRQTEKPDVHIHNPDTAGAVVRGGLSVPLDPKGRMKKRIEAAC